MQLLKQSTAATVLVGPVLDSAGVPFTGAIAYSEVNITKNGTTAAANVAATMTHSHQGHYLLALTVGDTDTLGRIAASLNKANYSMPVYRSEVLKAENFDAIVTTQAGTTGGMSVYAGAAIDLTEVTDYLDGTTAIHANSLSNILSIFTGMTSLPKWLRGLFRKSTMDATAKAEINATGGTYDEATDSLEILAENNALVKARTDLITSGNITVVNAVSVAGDTITINAGNSYTVANGHALEFTGTFPGSITSATLKIWNDGNTTTTTITSVSATSTQVIFEMSDTVTGALSLVNNYSYSIWDNVKFTPITGKMLVRRVQ